MTAAALDNAYECVGNIADGLIAVPGKNKVDNIIKVVKLGTNAESVEGSNHLLEKLQSIQDALPSTDADVDLTKCKGHLEFVNGHLTEINSFLDLIKTIFGIEHINVEIDESNPDANMYRFLANMQKAQDILAYISDYLTLVLKVQKVKLEEPKEYSLEALVEYIAA